MTTPRGLATDILVNVSDAHTLTSLPYSMLNRDKCDFTVTEIISISSTKNTKIWNVLKLLETLINVEISVFFSEKIKSGGWTEDNTHHRN